MTKIDALKKFFSDLGVVYVYESNTDNSENEISNISDFSHKVYTHSFTIQTEIKEDFKHD